MSQSTLRRAQEARKRAFRIALAQRGMTAAAFAAKQGVSRQAVSAVLLGKIASANLSRAIDQFIAKTTVVASERAS